MDFLEWWLSEHYLLSTIFTPALTLLWCIFKGLVARGLIAVCCILFWIILKD